LPGIMLNDIHRVMVLLLQLDVILLFVHQEVKYHNVQNLKIYDCDRKSQHYNNFSI